MLMLLTTNGYMAQVGIIIYFKLYKPYICHLLSMPYLSPPSSPLPPIMTMLFSSLAMTTPKSPNSHSFIMSWTVRTDCCLFNISRLNIRKSNLRLGHLGHDLALWNYHLLTFV